jgi:hypothetical protein
MDFNDAGATTIRAYLQALLVTLWQEGESFSGKRPFGNSGWEYDLYKALIKGGAIDGTVDEHGDIGTFDTDEANAAVFQAIESLTTA